MSESPGKVPGIGTAALLIFGVAVLFVLGGVPLQLLAGEPGIILAQVFFILMPAVLLAKAGGFDLRTTFSLRLPSAREVGGGVLLLAGALQTALVLAWLQSLVMPVPVDYLDSMADLLRADSPGRFLWLLLLAAVTPAIAEESLFRGVLLSSLRDKLPVAWAALITGVVFGIFHLTPETAFRFLPTAWLGVVLAWVVILSGSLPLAVLLHFINNATVLTLTALPLTAEEFAPTEVSEDPPVLVGAVGVFFLIWGARVFRRVREMPAGETATGPSRSGSRAPEGG